MTELDRSERIRLSVAADVGGIELLHASLNRRGVPPHMHDEYSLSVTLRGGLAFDSKGSRHLAASGVISCVAPGEVHNAYASRGERWEFLNLLIPTAVVQDVLASLEWREALPDLPRRVISDQDLAHRLTALHRLLEGRGDLLERQSARTDVLAEFFRRHSTARGEPKPVRAEKRAIERARELLHSTFSEAVPLARLASYAGLSPYHFLRTFHVMVGMPPHRYLNHVRVLEAKRRLSRGVGMAETALECGFCDQSHMNRQFKKAALITPAQYQNACVGRVAG